MIDRLPQWYWDVPYVYECGPGTTDMRKGANCQLFAYSVLEHLGLHVPPLRSSNLWEDTAATKVVTDLEPLDLLFFNRTGESFGAHLAIYLAPGQILHLCKEIGVPVIWSEADFAARPTYRTFVGAKRVTSACRT